MSDMPACAPEVLQLLGVSADHFQAAQGLRPTMALLDVLDCGHHDLRPDLHSIADVITLLHLHLHCDMLQRGSGQQKLPQADALQHLQPAH